MKLDAAIEKTVIELLGKYKEAKYKASEKVSMSSNTVTSNYMTTKIDVESLDVEYIEDRFDLKGTIDAVQVTFEVKYPRKRKFTNHYEYYKII